MVGQQRSAGSDTEQGSTVGILGAGLSGLLMGMQLRRAGIDDFTIYEKQPDVGGTWLRNTYPGLHCDIPSHLYSYSFEPHDWSMVYAGQPEIQAYLRRCAEKYDLIERIRFGTSVEAARYDADAASWTFELAGGERVTHRLVVSATGGLTEGKPPRLPGIERFSGPMWHSGNWRDDVDVSGLRVGVVGSAASAVQVVPEMAKRAAEVVVFSRTPNWVMPRNNRFYTEAEHEVLQSGPGQRRERRRQYRDALLWYRVFRRNAAAMADLRQVCLDNLRSAIDDPGLIAALTPDYDPGCKRILVSDEYYPALAQDHVHLVPHGVDAVDETGLIAADGSHHQLDVVIFCTGYRLGGRADGSPALEVYGREGERLTDVLRRRAEAYRGIAVPGFPNYFTVCGVNGTVAYGAVFASAELETEAIARFAQRLDAGEFDSIEVRAEVTRQWSDAVQIELQEMSWTGDCPNFYRDPNGRIVSFFPGTVGRMRRELRRLDDADFVLDGA